MKRRKERRRKEGNPGEDSWRRRNEKAKERTNKEVREMKKGERRRREKEEKTHEN